jgi:pimeloyl-ACP methyl ester carboxylesterase
MSIQASVLEGQSSRETLYDGDGFPAWHSGAGLRYGRSGTVASAAGFLASPRRESFMSERQIEGPQGLLNISAKTGGRGTPLLFIHSDAGNLHHWDKVRLAFDDRPTAALDRRGHGRSALPKSGSFAHGDAASDIAAAADALDYERFILIGHSGGALTSYAFASLEPDRLLGLVLVDPPPDPAVLPPGMIDQTLEKLRAAYERTVEQYYRQVAGENEIIGERIVSDARATPKETIIGTFEAMSRFNPAEFTNYEGPALSIIQPQYDVDGALHRIARMEHVAIDGSGHWIHLGAPDRFVDVLQEFISDYENPAPDAEGVTVRAERRTSPQQ